MLGPWTWPALDQLDLRLDKLDGRIDRMEAELRTLRELVERVADQAELLGQLGPLVELTSGVNHRVALLEDIAHATNHMNEQFHLVRDDVEIISALSLSLQRQAERSGVLEPRSPAPS